MFSKKSRSAVLAMILSLFLSIQLFSVCGYAESNDYIALPPSDSAVKEETDTTVSSPNVDLLAGDVTPNVPSSTADSDQDATVPDVTAKPNQDGAATTPSDTTASVQDSAPKTDIEVEESAISPTVPNPNPTEAILTATPRGIVIDPAKAYQQFEGWGTSLAWWGNAIGRWNGPKKQEVIDLLFDAENGLGLNIVRYNIGGGINPNELKNMRLHADVPSFQPEPGQWVLDADQYQREILQASLDKGVTITEAFSNGPPYWMTYSKSAAGSVLGITNNLYDDAYDDFANYIARVLKLYKEEYGIEFRTFAPLNEPVDHWWTKGNNQEGCHFDRDKQNLILKEVASRLRENGLLNTQISANEEASFENAAKSFLACDAYTRGEIAQINVHSYFGTDRKGLRQVAAKNGKRLWVSECGVGGTGSHNHNDITSCMQLTRKILWDLKDLSANGWLYWQAVEDEAGKNNWGFIHANFSGEEEYWVTKQYYTMMNYSKFIRPGCWILEVNDGDTLAAYDPQEQKVILVLTNDTSSNSSKQFDLSAFSTLSEQIAHTVRTSPTEDAAEVSAAQLSDRQLTVDLPATSVTTVVIEQCSARPVLNINDGREGMLNNHYQYQGAWNYASQTGAFDSDNHWSNKNHASYSISFNGTQISLYGAKAPNHGIATVRIDGEVVADVDLYAPQREEAVCYFESDTLPDGDHTLTVQVSGRKNAFSSGTYVTADYAQIEGAMQSIPANRTETELNGNHLAYGHFSHAEGAENLRIDSITDGRLDTFWSMKSSVQKRLIIPLQDTASINEVQVFAPDYMNYKIQVSSDGQTYTDIAQHESGSTNNNYWSVTLSAPQTAKSIAILCLPTSENKFEIAEFKVFGTGYTDVNDNTVGTNNMFLYSGNWKYYWFEKGAYLQDNHYTNQPGDSFSFTFSGTEVALYGAKAANHGQAEVYLDGVSQGIVDYYAGTRTDNVKLFSVENLTSGSHKLEVKVLNTKNVLSSDYFVTVDHIIFKSE